MKPLKVNFPKTARLLRSREFQFRRYARSQVGHFRFVFSSEGQGRLGISISKKAIKQSVGRNRVKRLLREAFRHHRHLVPAADIHVIGLLSLRDAWKELTLGDVQQSFDKWHEDYSLHVKRSH